MRRTALWVATEKHSVATPLLEFLLRHKVFCRDRNVPPLGKLYRDIRRPLWRPKPGLAPNPVSTLNFCHDTRPKNLCREKEGLCHNPNYLAYLGTVSRHKDPCRDTDPEGSVTCVPAALACLSCKPRPGRAPGLRTLW